MIKPFLELQQRELTTLGEERGRLREQLQREERRVDSLAMLAQSLAGMPGPAHPLHWQNRQGMRQQIHRLQAHQQQQLALAHSDLQRHEQQLLRQFGKVKGLEQVVSQREAEGLARQRHSEQKQLDELAQQQFVRRQQAEAG